MILAGRSKPVTSYTLTQSSHAVYVGRRCEDSLKDQSGNVLCWNNHSRHEHPLVHKDRQTQRRLETDEDKDGQIEIMRLIAAMRKYLLPIERIESYIPFIKRNNVQLS